MKFICTALVLGSLLAMQLALAENSSDSLTEIVVTAQRRAERLQDVPEAISALSGDLLNQMRLQGNADLAAYVPSLFFRRAGPGRDNPGNPRPRHRLWTRARCVALCERNPTRYPHRRLRRCAGHRLLRRRSRRSTAWAAGTLYGASSMGGAIRILTAQPDPSAYRRECRSRRLEHRRAAAQDISRSRP